MSWGFRSALPLTGGSDPGGTVGLCPGGYVRQSHAAMAGRRSFRAVPISFSQQPVSTPSPVNRRCTII